ncbi:MAG: hypothetical protein LJE62_13745 [Silicimonas sp.]|nr:hypothetical protein [Silicimonas sp.]
MPHSRLIALVIAIALPASAQETASPSGLPDCPDQFAARGAAEPYSTVPFDCYCSAEARRARNSYAYGGGPYEGISNICMAALHAGATGPDGGDVRVIPGPGLEKYVGTLANGVYSSDWDYPSQFGSFEVKAFSAP